VLRAIEEAGIEIDVIAGTSMGALIGAIFVAGKLDGLAARFLDFDWKGIVSLRWRAESHVQAEGACPMWRNTPLPESGFRVDNEKNRRRANKNG